MDYKVVATNNDTKARAGVITTDHGEILTPIFMPVGTVGSVKAVHMSELRDDIKATPITCICDQSLTSLSVLVDCTSSIVGTDPSSPIVAGSRCSR